MESSNNLELTDEIQDLLTCEICETQYEDPLILPCHNTVCSKHVYLETNGSKFKCSFCDKEHDSSSEKYPIDKKINKLLKISGNYINKDYIYLGENNAGAKDMYDELSDLMNKAKILVDDPEYFINEHFNELRNKIDLTKEQYVKMIEDNCEKIITQVNDLEKDCKSKLLNKPEETEELKKYIKDVENQLNDYIISFKTPYFDSDSDWKRIKNSIENEIEIMKYFTLKFQNALLLNREYNLIPKVIVDENNFGSLEINSRSTNEDRSEGTIRMEIKDFSTFKFSEEFFYNKDLCLIKKAPWKLSAIVKENADYELELEIMLEIDANEYVLKENKDFKIQVSMHILQNDLKFYKEIKKDLVMINGFRCYLDKILLKDILNPINNIYSTINDSIKVEALIKVIDVIDD